MNAISMVHKMQSLALYRSGTGTMESVQEEEEAATHKCTTIEEEGEGETNAEVSQGRVAHGSPATCHLPPATQCITPPIVARCCMLPTVLRLVH